MIRITNPEMLRRMDKALRLGGNLYTMEDIDKQLFTGDMQSHAVEDTWVITQVHEYPHKRAVNILFAVGNIDGALAAEEHVELWAKNIKAKLLTATGRDGWWNFRTPGWNKAGIHYMKDISHEQR